ncbi:DUF4493 domain-containing protein [Phocaeicola barnesiae]
MKYIKVFYTGLIGLLLAACTNDTFYSEKEEGTGYLRLALGNIDVELSSTSRAETVSLPDDLIPQTADFMIDIRQGNSSVEGFPKKYSELTEEGIELMAGGYTVTAYCGDNEPIQDTPYFSGSSTVQIYPGKPREATINASLANAMLVPSVSESLQNHYSAWTLTIKSGDSSIKLADNENADGYLFAQVGQPVNAVFEGTNILGHESSHEWTVISSAAAQTKYVIQCDPDIPVFSFGLNAVAEHTTDESGYLNGTKVSLSFGDLSNVPLSLISNWKATLVNATGEIVRSYTTNNFTSTGDMAVENDWSYLPQGNYTLRYSYTIDGNEVSEEATAIEAKTVTMPLPTFEAAVSAQTSYSVYTSQGATAANETDGSGIFDIATTTTISPEILSNEKYSNLLSVTYSLDSGESSTEESPTFQNLQWGTRKLTAFALFDGNNATSSVDCEVTGIPFRHDFRTNSDVSAWTVIGDTKYEADWGQQILYTYFNQQYARMYSPKFYSPKEINISYEIGAMYSTSGRYNHTCVIYSGVIDNTDTYSKNYEDNISAEKTWGKSLKLFTHEAVISSSNNMISVYHNEVHFDEFFRTEDWLYLSTIDVNYR